MNLARALDAESGVIAAVGAGGKKSTLYALASHLSSDHDAAVVVTATVRIPIFDPHVNRVIVTEHPHRALENPSSWPIGIVPARDGADRYRGYDPQTIDSLTEVDVIDALLVKADGARMREFKAPGPNEPRLPDSTSTVLAVVSLAVIGEPLSAAVVHRPERVSAITGRPIGERIRPGDVAAVLRSDRGALKDVPDTASVVPVLNKVDDDGRREMGERIADEVLGNSNHIDRVVLTRMIDTDPILAVLE